MRGRSDAGTRRAGVVAHPVICHREGTAVLEGVVWSFAPSKMHSLASVSRSFVPHPCQHPERANRPTDKAANHQSKDGSDQNFPSWLLLEVFGP